MIFNEIFMLYAEARRDKFELMSKIHNILTQVSVTKRESAAIIINVKV